MLNEQAGSAAVNKRCKFMKRKAGSLAGGMPQVWRAGGMPHGEEVMCSARTLAVSNARCSVCTTSSWCATSPTLLGRLRKGHTVVSWVATVNQGARQHQYQYHKHRRVLFVDPRLRGWCSSHTALNQHRHARSHARAQTRSQDGLAIERARPCDAWCNMIAFCTLSGGPGTPAQGCW